jgi:uroporphyrinogen III methyltransferase/synthase
MITFTSSSTVKNFKALLPAKDFAALIQGIAIASIGPITSDTAKKLGFDVHITAESYTIPGLVNAILRYYQND